MLFCVSFGGFSLEDFSVFFLDRLFLVLFRHDLLDDGLCYSFPSQLITVEDLSVLEFLRRFDFSFGKFLLGVLVLFFKVVTDCQLLQLRLHVESFLDLFA